MLIVTVILKQTIMVKKLRILLLATFFIPVVCLAQKDTLVKKLDSLSVKETKEEKKNNNISPSAYNDSTKFTLHNYFVLLGNDFKQQVTSPFHTAKKQWGKVVLFGAVAGGLAFADESGSEYFAGLANRSKTVSSVSNFITSFGGLYEVYTIGALTTYGFVFKNEKIKSTAFLATQAYITAGVISSALKYLTSRQRPDYYNQVTKEYDPVFHGPFYKLPGSNSSFPSGHTTVAFAAATVYAMEYRHHPWIPIAAYSFATVVGFSRMVQDKHWPTDVLAGAALGILSGRQVVNNYHRYMKIKQPERPVRQRKASLTFNLQPMYGKLLPGVTYSF